MKTFLWRAIFLGFIATFSVACSSGGGGTPTAQVCPRFVYVANFSANSVSTYWVDTTTGRLKYTATVQAMMQPESVTVDPSGRYAYVANSGSDKVTQYTIGADGSL